MTKQYVKCVKIYNLVRLLIAQHQEKKHTYCLKRMIAFRNIPSKLGAAFPRHRDVLMHMGVRYSNVVELFGSTSDYIKKRIFCDGETIVLTKNTFPYLCEPKVQHWVLWSKHELSATHVDDYVHILLPERLRGFQRIVHRNPPHLQSLPNIIHHHVFVYCDD